MVLKKLEFRYCFAKAPLRQECESHSPSERIVGDSEKARSGFLS
jgi:hypothetical protein